MDSEPLYRQIAQHYLDAIRAGTLAVGERMPSVRALMKRHSVSLSTALQACRQLEMHGVLEARARSGYFVRPPKVAPRPVAEPNATAVDPAQYVGLHERVSAVLAEGQRYPDAVNFSGACASPQLYPASALAKAAVRQLRAHPELLSSAVPAGGHPAFQSVLAKQALSARMSLSPEEIIVTQGCIEALNLALRAVAQPGDVIAVESPTFYGLLQILESLGMRAVEIPTSPQTGLSLEALELAHDTYPGIKAVVVVPNVQNPLGCVMPDSQKERLVRWCERQGIALIEDDTYAALTSADQTVPALKAWDRSGNVIHCASMHKILAPGMRLGWIAPGKWFARAHMLKYAQSRPNEALSQLAVADFMASSAYDRHLRRLRASLRAQREEMADLIAAAFPEGTRLTAPAGGLGLWVEMPGAPSSETVFKEALREGIRIAPGLMFSNSRRFDHFLRINCGYPCTPEVRRALQVLAKVIVRVTERRP